MKKAAMHWFKTQEALRGTISCQVTEDTRNRGLRNLWNAVNFASMVNMLACETSARTNRAAQKPPIPPEESLRARRQRHG